MLPVTPSARSRPACVAPQGFPPLLIRLVRRLNWLASSLGRAASPSACARLPYFLITPCAPVGSCCGVLSGASPVCCVRGRSVSALVANPALRALAYALSCPLIRFVPRSISALRSVVAFTLCRLARTCRPGVQPLEPVVLFGSPDVMSGCCACCGCVLVPQFHDSALCSVPLCIPLGCPSVFLLDGPGRHERVVDRRLSCRARASFRAAHTPVWCVLRRA